jgi:hypothetical protein
LLVAVVFVALTASFYVLLMGAALAAAARSAGRTLVARLLAAALIGALFTTATFLVRVHFDSFMKLKERTRQNRLQQVGFWCGNDAFSIH